LEVTLNKEDSLEFLSINELVKTYQDHSKEVKVLNNLELMIQPKELVSIIGKSGSGKSTLLSILAGIDKPNSGSIKLLGKSMNDMSEKELTSFRALNIGVVFQNYHLIQHLTAYENIELPLLILGYEDQVIKDRVNKFLEQVGLSDRSHHYPSQLSGGECQRVAIARAMVHDAKLILADEPTGSLDQETGDQVMNILFTLVKENHKNLILVTHDIDLANQCEKVFNLQNGQLTQVN
jgi:putative ABC transport system ATP-binding protein